MNSRLAVAVLMALALLSPALAWSDQGVLGVYSDNRREGVANFVTEDLVLTGFVLVQRQTLQTLEDDVLVPLYRRFIVRLSERVREDAGAGSAARANADFLALLAALDAGGCAGLMGSAADECARVMDARGIAVSPLWGYPLDYSQFQPRGRYTRSETLSRYFRSLRYAGSVLFAVKPSAATGVDADRAERYAAQALALVDILSEDAQLAAMRQELERLLSWRFGPPDDLTDADLIALRRGNPDPDARALFEHARSLGHQPRIIGGVLDASRLEAGVSAADAMTGWRLLPSRLTAESAAFQRLVFDGTGGYLGPVEPDAPPPFGLALINNRPIKGYPSVIELMALLGSAPARATLEQRGEDRFEGYPAAFGEAGDILAGATGLNGAALAFMQAALAAPVPGAAERLNAMRSFWTWQRYLDLLYVKQSYTLTGKGMVFGRPRAGAVLEPSTGVYRALAALVAEQQRHGDGSGRWERFADLLARLIDISARTEEGQPMSEDDERLLNEIDRTLLDLVGDEDGPIVVDIHTNPAEGQVVEEALGWAREVRSGNARGARFDPREFKQPLERRLTDAAWIEHLRQTSGEAGTHATD